MSNRKYSTYNDDFYHSKSWQLLRLKALKRDHYQCQVCLKQGKHTFATTVHHVIAVRADRSQALELDNLITVCKKCHNFLHPEKLKGLAYKREHIKAQKIGAVIFRSNREI